MSLSANSWVGVGNEGVTGGVLALRCRTKSRRLSSKASFSWQIPGRSRVEVAGRREKCSRIRINEWKSMKEPVWFATFVESMKESHQVVPIG